MKNQTVVTEVYTIREKGRLMAHLESFDWNFESFGPVCLTFSGKRIRMQYTGFSNVNGNPVAVLTVTDATDMSIEEIKEAIDHRDASMKIYIERAPD